MSAVKYWIWLSAQTKVSVRARAALVEYYGDAERAYFAPPGEYASIPGITARDAAILETRDIRCADRILGECDRQGIRIITMQDADYPQRLMNIFAPPAVLYVRGNLPDVDSTPSIAVIGTRRASPYGLKMGQRMAFEIAKCGGIVISVLSDGIDRTAAKGCLLAGGKCIGVLATSHESGGALYDDVAAYGALVSEYPPGTATQKSFFRDRNRIASGLSHGLVVVEAPEKSGCLLFAAEALEQGREIFAVPGNADAENSVGAIGLLKQGAKPATCGWDVMSEFEHLFPGRILCPEPGRLVLSGGEKTAESVPNPDIQAENRQESTKKEIDKEKGRGYIDLKEQLSQLSEEQLRIISAIEKGESHIDDIIENTGLSAAKVLSQLTVLEIKGFIHRSAGRRVSLNISSK